jgi:hypothetical protein
MAGMTLKYPGLELLSRATMLAGSAGRSLCEITIVPPSPAGFLNSRPAVVRSAMGEFSAPSTYEHLTVRASG